jgi:hypothetical protein
MMPKLATTAVSRWISGLNPGRFPAPQRNAS